MRWELVFWGCALFLLKKAESENCEVGDRRETVEHVLIRCKKVDVERKGLKDKVVEIGRECWK